MKLKDPILSRAMWTHGSGARLRGDLQAIAVACYLVSAPGSNAIGLYKLDLAEVAKALGVSRKTVSVAMRSIALADFAIYDESQRLVFVRNAAAVQLGSRIDDATRREIDDVLRVLAPHSFVARFLDLYGSLYDLDRDRGISNCGLPRQVETAPGPHARPEDQAHQGLSQDSSASYQPMTDPPGDIPISEEVKMRCAEAGIPVPSKFDVAMCLASARSRGIRRASWEHELVTWRLRQVSFDRNKRPGDSSGSMPVVKPAPYHEVAKPAHEPTEAEIEENKRAAQEAMAAFHRSLARKA